MTSIVNLPAADAVRSEEIAFVDLAAQQRRIRDGIEARIKAVLDHGKYIGGPEITELEETLAARTGAKVAVACSSGTSALIIPMLSRGISAGDAVFVPAFTYNATANAVLLTGAEPVFVDIDEDRFNMDPDDLERRIAAVRAEGRLTPRAIVPVDLFGSPANYATLSNIAASENLFLLADAAQSFGAELDGGLVGNLADATATSFFPGKALGAYGDAGAIFSRDEDDFECWTSIRWHGTDAARKESVRVGFNARMDSFQAAVLLEKLTIFDDEVAARRRIGRIYNERLSGLAAPQRHVDGAAPGYGYYAMRIDNRDDIAARLKEANIPTAIYYATPLHKMAAFKAYAPADGLPATERVAGEILSLPMHPYLTSDQVETICQAVEAAAQ